MREHVSRAPDEPATRASDNHPASERTSRGHLEAAVEDPHESFGVGELDGPAAQDEAPSLSAGDKDRIRGVVQAHAATARKCYDDGLAKDPALEGVAEIQFTIGPGGVVTHAVVVSKGTMSQEVCDCVRDALKTSSPPIRSCSFRIPKAHEETLLLQHRPPCIDLALW